MRTALIVDDHPFVRLAIKILLEKLDYEVVAEADNGVDAVQRARELEPQLIVMDLNIPRLDGLEVITRITALGLSSRIVVLTEQSPAFYSERCMRAGALGYVSKTAELDELQLAVRAVMLNKSVFPQARGSWTDGQPCQRVRVAADRESQQSRVEHPALH